MNDSDVIEGVAVNINEVFELDWKNTPKVMELKQDYQSAKTIQDTQVLKIDRWLDYLNITGEAKRPSIKGRSEVTPRLIRKQAEWRYSSLSEPFLSTDDVFDIHPVTHEDKESAIQNALVLNNQLNTKIDKVDFIDEYVKTVVDEGTVFVRVGWDYQEEEVEEEQPVFAYRLSDAPEVMQLQQSIQQQVQTNPEVLETLPDEIRKAHELTLERGVPVEAVQTGTEMVKVTKVTKNCPTLEICDYKNLVIDPTALGKLDKARFVIYSFETSLSELEKDGKYKNLDRIQVDNNSILSEPDHTTDLERESFTFQDKPRKRLVAHEYWGEWDIYKNGMVQPIVATWVGSVLIRLEDNPFPDKKHPFVSAQYSPVRKSTYGEPDAEILIDNQKIVGAVTRGMVDSMGRSANGQVAIRKDALDVTNRRKFEAGKDYEFNPSIDPKQAFYMHQYPEIPRSAEYMINLQHSEAESLTGVKAFHQGITGNALGDQVGGQKHALDSVAKRELSILRRLAEGIKKIGRKIIAMNAEFLSEEEVIRITNDEFVTVRRDDLAGNFDLRLSISTPEADNAKAQELSFLLQTTGQTMGPDFSRIIMADIARLRKMPDLAKRIEDFQPQPDPMAVKQAELQIQLLEAQVFNEQAKGQENAVDVGLKQAKTETELAKTRALHSESDVKDLNYLEQQSSVTHDREIDKIDTQRKSDLDKIAAKALIEGQESTNREI